MIYVSLAEKKITLEMQCSNGVKEYLVTSFVTAQGIQF